MDFLRIQPCGLCQELMMASHVSASDDEGRAICTTCHVKRIELRSNAFGGRVSAPSWRIFSNVLSSRVRVSMKPANRVSMQV
jgi:hypothetical protein